MQWEYLSQQNLTEWLKGVMRMYEPPGVKLSYELRAWGCDAESLGVSSQLFLVDLSSIVRSLQAEQSVERSGICHGVQLAEEEQTCPQLWSVTVFEWRFLGVFSADFSQSTPLLD